MSGTLVCKMPECGGDIDFSSRISLKTGCNFYSAFYSCSKCGRVHSSDGRLAYNRAGASVYLKNGQIDLVLEPKNFEIGSTYLTKGYLFVCTNELDENEMYKMVDIEPEMKLVFDDIDEQGLFLFHGENGINYRLHRGDVNYVEKAI